MLDTAATVVERLDTAGAILVASSPLASSRRAMSGSVA
jgi:hypothetical protein